MSDGPNMLVRRLRLNVQEQTRLAWHIRCGDCYVTQRVGRLEQGQTQCLFIDDAQLYVLRISDSLRTAFACVLVVLKDSCRQSAVHPSSFA